MCNLYLCKLIDVNQPILNNEYVFLEKLYALYEYLKLRIIPMKTMSLELRIYTCVIYIV